MAGASRRGSLVGMKRRDAWKLVASARVGRLATVDAGGRPHLVPVCFALVGDTVYSAVDGKPKSGRPLRRLANIDATGRACLLVDHYEDTWSALWWVRLDATARVLPANGPDGGEADRALAALADRYQQYADRRPPGPVIALDVTRWSAWSASGTPSRPPSQASP